MSSLSQARLRSTRGKCVAKRHTDTDIRESLRGLPCQWFFTWLSGCPLKGQKPMFRRTPLMQTIDSIGGFFIALMIGYWAINSGMHWSWLLLPVSWLFATGRARKKFITTEHQVAHSKLFEFSRWWEQHWQRFVGMLSFLPARLHDRLQKTRLQSLCNRIVGDFIGVVLFLPEVAAYQRSHAKSHHNHDDLATPWDEDAADIFKRGFVPGRPKHEYWSLVWRLLINPLFYMSEFRKRLKISLFKASRCRLVLSWIFLAMLVGLAWATNHWHTLLLVYFVPVFIGFPCAGLLQMMGRHFWGTQMDKLGSRERTTLVCQGRFLLDPYPGRTSPLLSRLRWWSRLLFYHLPVRIAVLNGDVQHHDWHHRRQGSREWTHSAYARMADIEAGCPGWEDLPPYTHAWSLFESMDRTFEHMSKAPPLTSEHLARAHANDAPMETI